MKELLKKLSLAFGPSGCEDAVRELIYEEIKDYIDESEKTVDALGNLIVHVGGSGKKMMICAHMDEVGFMVTGITENGSLRFGTVGGIDPICLGGKRVVSESGVRGAIGAKPIHLLTKEEREAGPRIKNMSIDIGADTKDEAEKLSFIGDYFTFDSDYIEYGNGYIKCKALDDRLGCAAMCQLIKDIKNGEINLEYDTYFAFTTREEIGYSGAFTATSRINPDYAIVIESKAVADIYGVDESKRVNILGDGVIISYADRGTIYDRALISHIKKIADENGIKNQVNMYISGGNDSANIQKTACGTRVSTLSCASRYIHSQSDVIHENDFFAAYEVVKKVLGTNIGAKE